MSEWGADGLEGGDDWCELLLLLASLFGGGGGGGGSGSGVELGQFAGLHSARQLVTTARKKTISEVGNLKASKGASSRCPCGSILTSGPIKLASVGQPSESMNWIEFTELSWYMDSSRLSLMIALCAGVAAVVVVESALAPPPPLLAEV